MNVRRKLLLLCGPIGLVGLSYVTAAPETQSLDHVWTDLAAQVTQAIPRLSETPPEVYGRAAARIQTQLPESWVTLDQSPFLVTGNVSREGLQQALDEVIVPTWQALAVDYFDHTPAEPITIVLMADEASYGDAVGRFGYNGKGEYAGLYSRRDRRVVLNLATGYGTLAHELTHALAHADFLKMPAWFDEGLASLHEECTFSVDGRRLIGQANWRDAVLRSALRRANPPQIEALVTEAFAKREANVDYALARNLCRYLQSQNLLGAYYRKCRARIYSDPTGGLSLLEITGCDNFQQLDAAFQAWFRQQAG